MWRWKQGNIPTDSGCPVIIIIIIMIITNVTADIDELESVTSRRIA